MKQIFSLIDTNGDGQISKSELADFLNINQKNPLLADIINEVDQDKDG